MVDVNRNVGVFCADITIPLLHDLALSCLVLQHSLWGSVESTDLTLVWQTSPLILPAAAVQRHVGVPYADTTTPLQNALVLRWLALQQSLSSRAESID